MPQQQQTSLSICIVSYNSTQDELRAAISSLLRAVSTLQSSAAQLPASQSPDSQSPGLPTPGPLSPGLLSRVTLYLVDNSSDTNWGLELFAEDAHALQALNMEVRLLRGQGNVGFGRGHNMVIPELQSTYHLILNPDVILDSNSLVHGINYLTENTATAIISPYATGYDGNKQHLCKTYPAVFTFFVRGFIPTAIKALFSKRLRKFEMHYLSEHEPGTGIPIVSGCCMLCRTQMLKKVQGFDVSYFLYFEDFDLSLRIGKIADITYLPTMRIQHAGGHAARKGMSHLRMFIKSAVHFYNTHGWRLFKQD